MKSRAPSSAGMNGVPCRRFSVQRLPPTMRPSAPPSWRGHHPSLGSALRWSWSRNHRSSVQVSDGRSSIEPSKNKASVNHTSVCLKWSRIPKLDQ